MLIKLHPLARYRIVLVVFSIALQILIPPSAMDYGNATSKTQIKIVGGATVPISFAPWQVALIDLSLPGRGDWQKQFCGGSIISQTWILTAAHCLEGGISLNNLKVLSGQAILNTRRLSGNLSSVKKIEIHNAYNSITLENDLALIQLTTPLVLKAGSVEIIQLPLAKPSAETIGRISGWGYAWPTSGNSSGIPIPGQPAYPSELMGGEVRILSDVICGENFGIEFKQNSMLCAQGGVNNQGIVVDTCYGDSGGPLAVFSSGTWFLAGITSWGIGCGWTTPGVYTNVTNYKLWIDTKMAAKIPQVITFSPPSTLTLAQSPFSLTFSSTSGLTPIISSNTPLICSVSGQTLNLLSVGSCNLSANQIGNDIFEAAPELIKSISVLNNLSTQTISFSPPVNLLLNQSPFVLSATSSSQLTPTISSQTPRTCNVNGFILTLYGIGRCTLTATQSGNAEFSPASPVTVNINIRRR